MNTLKKPEYGAPCNHCGLCCMLEICDAGELVLRETVGDEKTNFIMEMVANVPEIHCPMLRSAKPNEPEGTHFCRLVDAEQGERLKMVSYSLSIGIGCGMRDEKTSALDIFKARLRDEPRVSEKYANEIEQLENYEQGL